MNPTPPSPARLTVSPDGRVAIDRPPGADRLLLPALVNAHAHLELHRIGPLDHDPDAGFVGWVRSLRQHLPRLSPDDPAYTRWYTEGIAQAAAACREQGVGAVGDITRFRTEGAAPIEAASLRGVSYYEAYGLGSPYADHDVAAIHDLPENAGRVRHGVQPHAPYSAGPPVFQAACEADRPRCTHLSEMVEEIEFVARATGPFRDFLESINKWDNAFASAYSQGLTPVAWMLPYLRQRPWLLAHCNYLTDDDIALLAGLPDHARVSIAYCPIASEYFGHRDHRYRDLLAAGVNVCLGTDSIACQPPDEHQPYAILQQMRRLYRRDATDPATLVRMATLHGARALHLDGLDFTTPFASVAINPDDPTDPLVQALRNDRLVESLR
ncbi:MAG: amidohydrolase family protein [Planctomycetota bacterium]